MSCVRQHTSRASSVQALGSVVVYRKPQFLPHQFLCRPVTESGMHPMLPPTHCLYSSQIPAASTAPSPCVRFDGGGVPFAFGERCTCAGGGSGVLLFDTGLAAMAGGVPVLAGVRRRRKCRDCPAADRLRVRSASWPASAATHVRPAHHGKARGNADACVSWGDTVFHSGVHGCHVAAHRAAAAAAAAAAR